jgi:voltage-gated potassium channel
MKPLGPTATQAVRENYSVFKEVEARLEIPMLVLSLLWAVLLVIELTEGLGPWLQATATVVWIAFLAEFVLKFVIAPSRIAFLRRNWLTVVALALPALRVFRVARAVQVLRYGRAVRGLTLAKVLTAFNRGVHSLRNNLARFGFSYILGMTALVTGLGTAGIYYFERQAESGLSTWGDAFWFTAMLLTTIGCEYWPKSAEGRTLSFLMSLYSLAVLGYVTATLAAWLIGRPGSPAATNVDAESIGALREEVAQLRKMLENRSPSGPVAPG